MNSHINVILALKQEDQVHFSRWSTVKNLVLYGEKKKSFKQEERRGKEQKRGGGKRRKNIKRSE